MPREELSTAVDMREFEEQLKSDSESSNSELSNSELTDSEPSDSELSELSWSPTIEVRPKYMSLN